MKSARDRRPGMGTGQCNVGVGSSTPRQMAPTAIRAASPRVAHASPRVDKQRGPETDISIGSGARDVSIGSGTRAYTKFGDSRVPTEHERQAIDADEQRRRGIDEAMQNPFYATLYYKDKELPPMLPPSRFPTVPSLESDDPPGSRYKRPLMCPHWWVEESSKPQPFEKTDFRTNVDVEEKRALASEFIARNSDRMAIFDPSYRDKSNDEILEDLIYAPGFINAMGKLSILERTYVKGTSSDNVKKCLYKSKMTTIGEPKDPFIRTLSTPREVQTQKITRLLTPATAGPEAATREFRRGYCHLPEYGNFSRYNGILKSNEQAVLNR